MQKNVTRKIVHRGTQRVTLLLAGQFHFSNHPPPQAMPKAGKLGKPNPLLEKKEGELARPDSQKKGSDCQSHLCKEGAETWLSGQKNYGNAKSSL